MRNLLMLQNALPEPHIVSLPAPDPLTRGRYSGFGPHFKTTKK